ncbi:MAG TPA: hypothetical protein VKR57_01365 [Terriglobales bacterium]|jgi:hypothetical protein|nr:hypothetical protein [Terriglobales bacterium]
MKFVVEVPDREVFEAAEQPEDLAQEIAEVITSEIFSFSFVAVTPEKGSIAFSDVLHTRVV